ncbi:MAG TPA: acyl-ACP desaturase [Iamia sp.]|jgi:acyl-[acyl-carrier-protein] desaturase|nr:acyl-ACP desaturase [Iamia sp.]
MEHAALLTELTPTLETLVDRHLAKTKEWFPHEMIPWDRVDASTGAMEWSDDEAPMSSAVRSALFVNLLTEDNLPYYFNTIDRMFGAGDAWGIWARRWTAEEGRHSIVIRDYLTVTRMIDPVALERARMHQVSHGIVPEPVTPVDGLVYVALQELATRISHRATGKLLDDPAGYTVMARVAADENLHYLLYRDLVSAALELDPSAVVEAIERQVTEFEMPGTGIVDFASHALAIAKAGIYDLQVHHEQILVPVVLRHWAIEELEGLTPEAEEARRRLVKRIDRVGRAGRRLAERWSETEAAERAETETLTPTRAEVGAPEPELSAV